jgi:hypothetical protein
METARYQFCHYKPSFNIHDFLKFLYRAYEFQLENVISFQTYHCA